MFFRSDQDKSGIYKNKPEVKYGDEIVVNLDKACDMWDDLDMYNKM